MSQNSVQAENAATLRIDVDEVAEAPFVMVANTPKVQQESDSNVSAKALLTMPLLVSWMVAILGSFQFGYSIGVTGAVHAKEVFPGHSKFSWSLMVSIFSVGGLFGALVTGRLLATWSRKNVMLLGAVVYTVSGLIMGGSVNIMMLTIGRFLVGFGGGSSTVLVPLYLKEIAPARLRGTLGTGHQTASVGGVFIVDLLAFGFAGASVSVTNPGWRFLMGFTALTGVLQIVLLPFIVESPSWLTANDRLDQGQAALARLRGTTEVSAEFKGIRHAMMSLKDDTTTVTIGSVLSDRSLRRRLVIGILLHAAMRCSGFNAVTFYVNQILEQSGIHKPAVGTAAVGTVNLIATLIAFGLIDRLGRRPLLLWSCIGMLASAIVLTLSLKDMLVYNNTVSVAAVMGFVGFFEIGLGPIPWTLCAEMLPAKSRATALSLAIMVNWSCLFGVGLIFPTLQATLEDYTFMPFAVFHVLSIFLVVKFVPETKNKSVDEINEAIKQM